MKNVNLEKAMVTCNIVNSFISVLSAFDNILAYYSTWTFELNKTFDEISSNNSYNFNVLFIENYAET